MSSGIGHHCAAVPCTGMPAEGGPGCRLHHPALFSNLHTGSERISPTLRGAIHVVSTSLVPPSPLLEVWNYWAVTAGFWKLNTKENGFCFDNDELFFLTGISYQRKLAPGLYSELFLIIPFIKPFWFIPFFSFVNRFFFSLTREYASSKESINQPFGSQHQLPRDWAAPAFEPASLSSSASSATCLIVWTWLSLKSKSTEWG